MIKLENLTKYFDDLKVLEKITFEIKDGESLAVIGPSGCGKSTLLKLLLRLEEPTAGKVIMDGMDISRLSQDGLINLRKKIGMIFQSSALFDSLNVFENVAFALRQHTHMSDRQISRVVKDKLKMVDLEGTEDLMPSELSGGMQKRVSIARALAFDPRIILYDEPTTGLDPITSVNIENLMIKLSRELKVTCIIVTHVLQTVYRAAHRIVMLHEGKFIETGSPEATKRSANPVVREFITGGLSYFAKAS
jgi:phospholipid/cholesterol/gamma-HCH transport system ATP-binding protein